MGAAACGARERIDLLGKAAILAAALLLSASICPPAAAQSRPQDQPAKPASKAAKPRTPGSPNSAQPKSTKPPAPSQQAKLLDPAKIDPMKIDPMEIDPSKLDAKMPNAWIALGRMELRAGNLAGAGASFEHAMALGEQSRNKGAVAAAALSLGRLHTGRFGLLRSEASNVALFGARPGDELTGSVGREFQRAKVLIEQALALHKALDRKDAMATDYANLGDLYSTAKSFDQAEAMIREALALNKALQRKKELAANYRALAGTQRYDLDQAEALLKEAAALHEALVLKEEMATDYEKLAAINTTRGEPYEAERLYKEALALAPRAGQIAVLRALEKLYRDRNDPGQAAEIEEQARALDKEREKDTGGRMLLFDSSLGLFVSSYAAKDQFEALQKAVPMEKTLRHRLGQATSYVLLGLHYGQRAEIFEDQHAALEARAEAMFKDALTLDKSLGREEASAHVYRELARLRNKRGDFGEVEATLKEAVALHKKLGEEDSMTQLYFSLGYDRERRGDTAKACVLWRSGALTYPNNKRLAELGQSKCSAVH